MSSIVTRNKKNLSLGEQGRDKGEMAIQLGWLSTLVLGLSVRMEKLHP